MRRILAVLAAAVIGTSATGQEFYGGASLDYAYPHSGDDQAALSMLGGVTTSGAPFRYGFEAEVGLPLTGQVEYDTSRVRLVGFYDLGNYEALVTAGWTRYDFGTEINDGRNVGLGVQRDVSDRYTVRGEFIRDFMDDSFTAAVTTTRVSVIYNFW